MKKVAAKNIIPFYFKKMTRMDMCNLLNKLYPVKLKHNADLIDRIYNRYPTISKTQISIIVMKIFQSMRELLILGRIFNFGKLFNNCKMHITYHREFNRIYPVFKIKINTPKNMR